MNYIITYSIRGNRFRLVTDDDGFASMEVRQDNGELFIEEVLEAPGERI